jgi:hypothetical protein
VRCGERERHGGEHHDEADDAEPRQAVRSAEHEQQQTDGRTDSRDDVSAERAVPALGQRVREPRIVRGQLPFHLLEHALLVLGERHPDPRCQLVDLSSGSG